MSRNGRAARRAATAAALGAALLLGCAGARSVQQTVSGWLGSEPRPHAYYAGVARAKLHREPQAASTVVGELALHEGVLSYRVEDGFAYVESQTSGRSGWVRQNQLIEQLPATARRSAEPARAPAPAEPEPEAPSPAPAAEEQEVPEPAVSPEPEPAAEPTPAPQGPSDEESVFDPY